MGGLILDKIFADFLCEPPARREGGGFSLRVNPSPGEVPMRKITTLLAAAAMLLGTPAARADTVEVTSTTLLTVGPQTRGGAPGVSPDVVTVAPAYEMIDVSARGVTNSFAKDLQLVVSTWGSVEMSDHRWDAGTSGAANADLVTAYVSGRVAKDAVLLRLGREMVMAGVGRMLHIDGGEAALSLDGFRVSAYAGAPVSQRFQTRSGVVSWNPMGGDLAYGGRVSYTWTAPGFAGRGCDFGASFNEVTDGGELVRQEVALDGRLGLWRSVTATGFAAYSPYESRFSEITAALDWNASKKLFLTADYRFTAPDLFLSRQSILSVFSDSERQDVGGGARYDLGQGMKLGLDAHLAVQPGRTSGTYYGSDGSARFDWRRGDASWGVEGLYLNALENGYYGARLFGRKDWGRWFGTADVLGTFFREKVNGQTTALTGTLTAGLKLAHGFSAVLSGRAGVTPYMEQAFDVMAKLVYNQTYTAKEVR